MQGDQKRLDHFLSYEIWKDAHKLLNAQVAAQSSNRHYKTPSMISYHMLGDAVRQTETQAYFDNYVANGLFYGLENWFAIYPYVVPKDTLGLRPYKHFTYPLLAVYYSMGLYLARLSQEYITNFYRQRKRIASYYGGRIHFEKDNLIITKENLYFKSFYKKFRNLIRSEARRSTSSRIIIRLDIQNYYEEISVTRLLELLDKYIKPSIRKELQFDTSTREQIGFFFHFLSPRGVGIPQFDNSLVSGFIAYLYLIFGDMLIEEELLRRPDVLSNYRILRYVDDTYISLDFCSTQDDISRAAFVGELTERIADQLYACLGLRLNPKTTYYWLSDEKQKESLLRSLKKISPEYPVADEDDITPIENRLDNIFDELEKMKRASPGPNMNTDDLADEILKEVFEDSINQSLSQEVVKQRIRELFDEQFDFNLVKKYALPMIIIIMKDRDSTRRFRDFLCHCPLTTRNVDLILTYLCQVDFEDVEMLKRLGEDPAMAPVVDRLMTNSCGFGDPGYYTLNQDQVNKLTSMPYVIEQIRYRILNERAKSYGVALNHLVNEIHAICYHLDCPVNHSDYDATKVLAFLASRQVAPRVATQIRNLFDRRNANQISHPGSDDYVVWSVSEQEYHEYRRSTGECLGAIL